ncbi:hypothetical protein ACSYDW_07860 [Paeniglutamicibacter sp. R2-26]|uniref:hypothetical protein n=1 Tax=Paeniglutamicibacter sp. R2-26 TaxID=3144417 RepID=UPI003EE432FF
MSVTEVQSPDHGEIANVKDSAEIVASQNNEMALLGIEDGFAVLFADHAPKDLDLIGFDVLGTRAGKELSDKFASTAVLGNLATLSQVGNASALSAQGLVQLAPESLAILNQAGNTLMQTGGQSLGTIVNAQGTIVASARFLPVAAGQAASLPMMLGPSVALLALQMQLASISRRVDENIELTRDVLRALHQDQWATLLGLHETSLRALEEARVTGTVNDHIFAPLASRDADLRKQRHLFTNLVKDHIKSLEADLKTRRGYIQKNFDQIIADTHGMLMAEFAWYRTQVLRCSLISHDDANAVENEPLLASLVEETKNEHANAMNEVTGLLSTVERQVRLLAVLPAARSLPFTSKRRSIDDALAMSAALADIVAKLRNTVRPQPTEVDPEVTVFKAEIPQKLAEILEWTLPNSNPVLALADVNEEKLISNNAYLGLTKDSFFVAGQGELLKEGVVDRIIPLADVRYARFMERPKKGPALDIITKDENLSFTFDSWATDGQALADAQRLAYLFATAMNLPEQEQRSDPLLQPDEELTGADKQLNP